MMGFIQRKWTAREAEKWTKEDTITVIISPLIYVALMIGVALSMLLIPVGFVILAAGIVMLLVMIYIINPKLTAVSEDYESKQKNYLEDLDKKIKWEDRDE
jgi:hypothetical protein